MDIKNLVGRGNETILPVTADKAIIMTSDNNNRLDVSYKALTSRINTVETSLIRHPNLLINSYFKDVIDQRQHVWPDSPSQDEFIADGWQISSGVNMYIDNTGLHVTSGKAYLVQKLDTTILSFLNSTGYRFSYSGTPGITGQFFNDEFEIIIPAGATLEWVKLEQGNITTPYEIETHEKRLHDCQIAFPILLTTGLTFTNCSLADGGYYRLGQQVTVQLRLLFSTAGGSSTPVSGLPKATGSLANNVMLFNYGTHANTGWVSNAGVLTIYPEGVINSGDTIRVSGTYLTYEEIL